MKKMNYVFYTGVIIIIFLIVSPIYWQYEVNEFHDAPHFYKINDFEGHTVEESYKILESHSSSNLSTFYIVRPTSSEDVDLTEEKYYFNYNNEPENYRVENIIKFSVNDSDLTSFTESNGYIYSGIEYQELNAEFSSQGLSIAEAQDIYENDLGRFLYENSLPILVVIFFTFIISMILTLGDVKEAAILSLQGASELGIKLKLICRTFKGLLRTAATIFLLFAAYKLLQGNHLSSVFFKFYFYVIFVILVVYTFIYILSLFAVSSVNIVNVLKNKDYSKPVYVSLLVIQTFVIMLVPFLFLNYLKNYENVRNTKNEILRVYELENYYTYYGVNANYYDSRTDEELTQINEDFKRLYNDHIKTSYYFEPRFTQYSRQYGESIYQMPLQNMIYMDENYFNEIAHFSKVPMKEIKNNTVLIPLSFKENTKEIIENLDLNLENIEIRYIDDDVEIYFDDYNSGYYFSDNASTFRKKGIHNVIVITSPNNLENTNPYANTIFIDKMTNGSIFFEEDSLQSMMDLTRKYNIEKMVTAESKISPYNHLLYDLGYTYKIVTYTLALTLIAVIIIHAFTAEIIMSTKRKLIAIGFLYGKNIMFSLKNYFILYFIASLIPVCAIFLMNRLNVKILLASCILYLYICLHLTLRYMRFTNKEISALLKGE